MNLINLIFVSPQNGKHFDSHIFKLFRSDKRINEKTTTTRENKPIPNQIHHSHLR